MSLGIIAAVNQNGIIDYISVTISILFYSMPNFVMGFVLILLFVIWLPSHGIDFGLRPSGIATPRDWILPTIALGAAPLATISRYTRSSMIDVIRSDYVRTARAKGLAQRKVILKHVLKNALIPVVTLIGPIFAIVGTGSFFCREDLQCAWDGALLRREHAEQGPDHDSGGRPHLWRLPGSDEYRG